MPTAYTPAERWFQHNGVNIFYVYYYDDRDSGMVRSFSYSLSEDSRDEDDDYGIFLEDLTTWPYGGTLPMEHQRPEGKNNDDIIKEAIIAAIDNGELADLIAKAKEDGVNDCTEEEDAPAEGVDEAAPIAFIRKVDWEALQSQKTWLMCFQPDDPEGDPEDPEGSLADAEKAEGLFNLIDALQDAAVKSGIDAKEVFGF